ncbi:MAG TPA: hypothetical protein VKA18_04995 [Alphaproteobacteria bacterium]|nr:hypothetical protein [Alphaproteobacteria bacterium]
MTDFEDRDIEQNARLFQAAISARHIDLPAVEVKRMLIALDGSNQDRAVLDLSRAVATRLNAEILLTYAFEAPQTDEKHERYLTERLESLNAQGFAAKSSRAEQGARAYRQILALARPDDLIVTASPFLEDYLDLEGASVGTTTDILLHRRAGPLLTVRKPAERVRARLEDVVLPLHLCEEHDADAVAWALRLVPEDGIVHLLAIVDDELLAEFSHLVGESFHPEDMSEETLAGLGHPHTAGLVAAAQRQAAEQGIDCRVTIRHGHLIPAIAEFVNEEPRLLVIGCDSTAAAGHYQRAAALVRESANPVLVV